MKMMNKSHGKRKRKLTYTSFNKIYDRSLLNGLDQAMRLKEWVRKDRVTRDTMGKENNVFVFS